MIYIVDCMVMMIGRCGLLYVWHVGCYNWYYWWI